MYLFYIYIRRFIYMNRLPIMLKNVIMWRNSLGHALTYDIQRSCVCDFCINPSDRYLLSKKTVQNE